MSTAKAMVIDRINNISDNLDEIRDEYILIREVYNQKRIFIRAYDR